MCKNAVIVSNKKIILITMTFNFLNFVSTTDEVNTNELNSLRSLLL